MRSLRLVTMGRRSGERRETWLYYVPDGENMVIVPSNAGRPRSPAWWLNLQAEPEADVRLGKQVRPVRARTATTEEEARLWPRLVEAFPLYERYRARTDRHIPVVILEPRSAEGGGGR